MVMLFFFLLILYKRDDLNINDNILPYTFVMVMLFFLLILYKRDDLNINDNI